MSLLHHNGMSWHIMQESYALHLSLQGDIKVPLEEIAVSGACHPACHDFSFYIFDLILFFVFYQHIIHVDWGVAYNHHLRDVHL